MSFGRVIRQRGEGKDEELLLKDFDTSMFGPARRQSSLPWLNLHTKCYSEIFLRACEHAMFAMGELNDLKLTALYEALQNYRYPDRLDHPQVCWSVLSKPSPGFRRLKEEPRGKRQSTHEQIVCFSQYMEAQQECTLTI